MNLKIIAIALSLGLLQACSYTGHVESVSGAAEIMPARHINSNADVRIDADISNANKRVRSGYMCGEYTYNLIAGTAITESILRTMEGAFNSVTHVESLQERSNTYLLDFALVEFSPRLKFMPGLWGATSEGSTELSIRVRATKPDGELAFQTTARGEGRYEDGSTGCDSGMAIIEEATRKAMLRTMEDLAQKLINSKALVTD